ncbi:histidinol dehydrogenase [Methanobacterium sp. CWC-01]|uniref:histidinol dehydrogenase n=1 Tax=Methanobacterium aridiramus TaxID=2584467 RepID=UPI002578E4DE|nr:histidinol dehydrogenase [Methanobacterium sp. CWC-01]WJI08674.1 histidinol dehydrogenase [Methanobacterium sp. CWC-01]
MKIIKLKDQAGDELLYRAQIDSESVIKPVREIISDVRKNGDQSLKYYTQKFDGVSLRDFQVSSQEIDTALERIEPPVSEALESAAQNITKFHQAQLPPEWSINVQEGITAGQIIRPLEKVGCYIPGGRAVYPSTILMTVIPARVAGVEKVICCTPPDQNGTVKDVVLAAAHLAGAHQIYKVGGAQAIAAMAYGTETIPMVDKIVGPGNIYVTAAKKEVYGTVDIDFPAGPSEVLILADEGGNPEYIALDLLAQAEHDPEAASVLVTTSPELAEEVSQLVKQELPLMKRREIIEESLAKYGHIFVASSMEEAVRFTNRYAPEHLIIMTNEPEKEMKNINNAGSIFLGDLTPVAAGDYGSGTNHVLPTSFCARMYSGLSTESFLKKPTVQKITKEGLDNLEKTVVTLAEYEGLYAHAESFKRRISRD